MSCAGLRFSVQRPTMLCTEQPCSSVRWQLSFAKLFEGFFIRPQQTVKGWIWCTQTKVQLILQHPSQKSLTLPALQANALSTWSHAGLRLKNAALSTQFLGQIDHLYIDISRISIDLLDVSFPTWSRPLTITVKNLTAELVQRSIPRVHCHILSACQCQIVSYQMTAHDRYMHDMQYTDPGLLEAVTKLNDQQITSAKLDAVEKLLWGHVPRQPGKAGRGMLILLLQIVSNSSSATPSAAETCVMQATLPECRPVLLIVLLSLLHST